MYLLDIRLQGQARLDDEFLGQHVGVLLLGLLRVHDVDQDDVEQLVGHKVCLGDERTQDVKHEALHLAGMFVTETQSQQLIRDRWLHFCQ